MKAKTTLRTLPLVIAIAFGSGAALAQTSGSSGSPGSTTGSSATGGQAAPAAQPGTGTRNSETRKDEQLARGDRKFIQDAAEGGMFEVQVAQLAASKATDPAVKDFANKLVQDHQQANNELVQLANSKHVELPAAPSRGQRHAIEKLGKKSGAEFDKDFVQQVGLKDHEKDIKKFEKAAEKVKDPDLKAWAQKTLPHLREHYALAQKLPEAGKSNAASMGNRGATKTGS
jgi:putative membrane protein